MWESGRTCSSISEVWLVHSWDDVPLVEPLHTVSTSRNDNAHEMYKYRLPDPELYLMHDVRHEHLVYIMPILSELV